MKRMLFLLALLLPWSGLRAQWSEDPLVNNQLNEESFWTTETVMLPDGSFYLVGVGPVGSINRVTPTLQYFDKDGRPVWDEWIVFGIDSTMSWTKTMTHMMVDKDGNAIVVAQDLCGDQLEKYTAWKVSPEGEFLWDERGVNLHGGTIPDYYPMAALKMTQLSDGNYLFAWMGSGILLQKISPEGEVLWGSGKNMGSGAYPYVVDAGDGDFILVYQSGGLRARRLDMDGNDVWESPVVAFSGELNPQIPLWTYLKVYPAAGGVVLSYYGFKEKEHFPYISFVKGDGTHAFPEADEGLRLGYSDNWGYEPALAIDEENGFIYGLWEENRPGTNFTQRFVAQKVNFEGELLWDPEGVELAPLKERAIGYPAASLGPKGTVLFGFMEHAGVGISAGDPILLQTALMNSDGSYVWAEKTKQIGPATSTKFDVQISSYINDQWVLFWEDCRVNGGVADGHIFAQNIRVDGSFGPTVATAPQISQIPLTITPNPIEASARIEFSLPVAVGHMRISLCTLNAAVVETVFEGSLPAGEHRIEWNRPARLAAGMYLLQMTADGNHSFGKVILR